MNPLPLRSSKERYREFASAGAASHFGLSLDPIFLGSWSCILFIFLSDGRDGLARRFCSCSSDTKSSQVLAKSFLIAPYPPGSCLHVRDFMSAPEFRSFKTDVTGVKRGRNQGIPVKGEQSLESDLPTTNTRNPTELESTPAHLQGVPSVPTLEEPNL